MGSQDNVVKIKELLNGLNLGNSVAEFDDSLEDYFVETDAFNALVQGKVDIIAGDKGTGKTAVYKILQKRFGSIKELKGIEVLAGFNPAGSPIFQKLVRQPVLTEGQYSSVWKAYFLSLVGNWILEIVGDNHSDRFVKLDHLLTTTGLRSKDDKPETIFSRLINSLQRLLYPKSAELAFTFSETGIPIITPKLEFSETPEEADREVSHEHALRLLNDCLDEIDYTVWLALDRLDEAFLGFPGVEVPALRALFRTYLDMNEFSRVRLKLFVRRDLFRKIIGQGFVNLTHINAKKKEILWDEGDLLNLLVARVRENKDIYGKIGGKDLSDEQIFYRLFPNKIDQATRKPVTWKWMMSRIRDGNNVRPPRNLIDLANLAREEQLRIESRSPRDFTEDLPPLMSSEAVKKAHARLSVQRVEDTLLAESVPALASLIDRFRKSKSEHNVSSLEKTLSLSGEQFDIAVKQLLEAGFLEPSGVNWKIPMLYRDGLEITQGKAYLIYGSVGNESEDEEESDD